MDDSRFIVAGLDLSLTSTGIAVLGHVPGGAWCNTVILGSPPCAADVASRADRLTDLATQIINCCAPADLICIERPAYSSNTGSVTDRAGLWWLVCARLVRGLRIPVVDITTQHLKIYATGKGTASKDQVLAETARRYQEQVPNLNSNDVADALQLAALGWHRLTGAPVVNLPVTHQRAVNLIKWPTSLQKATSHG